MDLQVLQKLKPVGAKEKDEVWDLEWLKYLAKVGETIEVNPKILVCGEERSGKSSIMATLTGLPIPSDADHPVRYAKEIRFRRTTGRPHVQIRIERDADEVAGNRADALKADFSVTLVSVDMLPVVLDQAAGTMMLCAPSKDYLRPFSKTKLIVEVVHPRVPTMTFIDIPGLVFDHLGGRPQEQQDALAIMNKYLAETPDIVLVVLDPLGNAQMQWMNNLVAGFEGMDERMVRVITKPDMMLDNLDKQVKAAYFVGRQRYTAAENRVFFVKNRGPSESHFSAEELREAERRTIGWTSIAYLHGISCGTDALRNQIGIMLRKFYLEKFEIAADEFMVDIEHKTMAALTTAAGAAMTAHAEALAHRDSLLVQGRTRAELEYISKHPEHNPMCDPAQSVQWRVKLRAKLGTLMGHAQPFTLGGPGLDPERVDRFFLDFGVEHWFHKTHVIMAELISNSIEILRKEFCPRLSDRDRAAVWEEVILPKYVKPCQKLVKDELDCMWNNQGRCLIDWNVHEHPETPTRLCRKFESKKQMFTAFSVPYLAIKRWTYDELIDWVIFAHRAQKMIYEENFSWIILRFILVRPCYPFRIPKVRYQESFAGILTPPPEKTVFNESNDNSHEDEQNAGDDDANKDGNENDNEKDDEGYAEGEEDDADDEKSDDGDDGDGDYEYEEEEDSDDDDDDDEEEDEEDDEEEDEDEDDDEEMIDV